MGIDTNPLLGQSLSLFGLNIYFLIGALFALVVLFILLFVTWTGLNIWMFHARQRRSMKEYYQRTRRADGRMYPPFTGGICDQCGRIQKLVYHLATGQKLCKDCYEPFWRQVEGWVDPQVTHTDQSRDREGAVFRGGPLPDGRGSVQTDNPPTKERG